jgi:hypothetical protein
MFPITSKALFHLTGMAVFCRFCPYDIVMNDIVGKYKRKRNMNRRRATSYKVHFFLITE